MTEETDISEMITPIMNLGKNVFTSWSNKEQDEMKDTVSTFFTPIMQMLHQKGHIKIRLNEDVDTKEGQEAETFLNGMFTSLFDPEGSFNINRDEDGGLSVKFGITRSDIQPDEHQQDSHNRQDLHDLHQHDQSEQLDKEPDLYELSYSSDEEDERLTIKEMLFIAAFICSITLYCFF